MVCNKYKEKYKYLIYILDVKLINFRNLNVEVEGEGNIKCDF